MAFTNYSSTTLRASAATSGTSEQDTAVTIPETVTSFWVVVDKTAEANADNLLTVRLQAQVGSTWFDLSWDSITTTGALTTAADTATDVTRTPNIVDASTAATLTVLAHYKEVPSNVLRVASVSSGTTPANTFSVECLFPFNKF
jgi:hypothetical protein